MIYFIFNILISFFACIGVYFAISLFFDIYTIKKTGICAFITVKSIKNPRDFEYAIRILEAVIGHCAFSYIIREIILDTDCDCDKEIIQKLKSEYKNIKSL